MNPILLDPNQPPDRFYRGGSQIARFRRRGSSSDYIPEDWVASTTTVHGHSTLGLTRLPNGSLLVDEIKQHATAWLGAEHVQHFGTDTHLLVKLLDAGQRLPVHAHPDRSFARRHLDVAHGKAEAWYVLSGGDIHLGLRRNVTHDELVALVEAQHVEQLLALLHRVTVEAGQTVYVPPGVLHAIGEGVLVVEVQEPTDLSILLEWRDFAIDGEDIGDLGLGFETALRAVETRCRSDGEIAALINTVQETGDSLVSAADEYFRLERLTVDGEEDCDAGFAVLIVTDGECLISPHRSEALLAAAGQTLVMPHACGQFTLRGNATVLAARPPRHP
uniref:Mannose-6-phosphate isomerase n=1 Tax=Mycolicibacterium brisbanense TaxID=146020 RepID=B8R4H8_9MYCO|nr:hypothetical protein [Mycolicibacterium brisbanense]